MSAPISSTRLVSVYPDVHLRLWHAAVAVAQKPTDLKDPAWELPDKDDELYAHAKEQLFALRSAYTSPVPSPVSPLEEGEGPAAGVACGDLHDESIEAAECAQRLIEAEELKTLGIPPGAKGDDVNLLHRHKGDGAKGEPANRLLHTRTAVLVE